MSKYFNKYIFHMFLVVNFSCSIQTYIAISNDTEELVEIHFYLKDPIDALKFERIMRNKENILESNDKFLNEFSDFLSKWKTINSKDILNYNNFIQVNPIKEGYVFYDPIENKIILNIETYTAVIIYTGYNFRNPLNEYIRKIKVQTGRGTMIFQDEYVRFPFYYKSKCDCHIWYL
ncbi:hypothetical protein [Leptospira sp. GIMC2001]|uniref:hypothetical protein n=1 Tax=Leptospira sp. GIMC2001 TaxID=1513297 RepID=UPI00234BC96B|nr:hypothetical protein [Leptospira sp. GIMC2001]WCL50689.1 hypothetical protein O4O04_07730 [Leptospira sp. GIMC2001]